MQAVETPKHSKIVPELLTQIRKKESMQRCVFTMQSLPGTRGRPEK